MAADTQSRTALATRLDAVGFYATANDVRAGRVALVEVVHRLRRDAPRRNARNRAEIAELIRALEVA